MARRGNLPRSVFYASALISVLACGGGGTGSSNAGGNRFITVEPKVIQSGEPVVAVIDNKFRNTVTATLDNVAATVTNVTTDGRVRIISPPGLVDGPHRFKVFDGGTQVATFVVNSSANVVAPEVEPNNNVNGSNATVAGDLRQASGNLFNTTDLDAFRFNNMSTIKYTVTVSPPREAIYINGETVQLDEAGTVTFLNLSSTAVVAVKGSDRTGDYTIKLEASLD